VSGLCNLAVDLDDAFSARAAAIAGTLHLDAATTIERSVGLPGDALAWIDETFGGTWSSEAAAGDNLLARRNGHPVGFATVAARDLRFRWLRSAASEPGTGLFGPFGVSVADRGTSLGRFLLLRALLDLSERGYRRALIAAVGPESLIRYYATVSGAAVVERYDRAQLLPQKRVVVLASGSGTNVQAVLDARDEGRLPVDLAGAIVNRTSAFAAERVLRAGTPATFVVWDRSHETRERYDLRLLESVAAMAPDVLALLGWMHLLDHNFVRAFPRIVNLHPAYLPLDFRLDRVEMPDGTSIPAFRGAHAIRDAVAAGSPWGGATMHDVTPDTDRGPVLARRPVRLARGIDEAGALERIRPLEHEIVVTALLRCLYES
jgi:phosphoribosylglycinamide formyltransferase-1